MTSQRKKKSPAKQSETEGQNKTASLTAATQLIDHSSLSQHEVAILAETFRLLGDPSRLRILLSCLPGPISVGDIADKLDLSLSLVSHHLRLLRGARLVKGERHAKQIFYEIADYHVSHVLRDMAIHVAEDHIDD